MATGMTEVLAVLGIAIPFFAVIFTGTIAAWRGFLSKDGVGALARFAFYIALPPFLFLKIAVAPLEDLAQWSFILRYETTTVVCFGLTVVLGLTVFRLRGPMLGVVGLNGAYPNFGYMGLPLAVVAFGEKAAVPAAVIFLVDNALLVVMSTLLVEGLRATGAGLARAALTALARLFRNPLILSSLAGLVYAVSGLSLPGPVVAYGNMLAGAAAPVALFALGATLWGMPVRGAVGEVAMITIVKLAIQPTLAAFLLLGVPGIDPLWQRTGVLLACLPVAANVFVLSQAYGVYIVRTSTAILVTTILSVVTVPLFLLLLGAG